MGDTERRDLSHRQKIAWHLREAARLLEEVAAADEPARPYPHRCRECGCPVYPGVDRVRTARETAMPPPLPDRRRALHTLHDRTIPTREITRRTGVPEATVRRWRRRADIVRCATQK